MNKSGLFYPTINKTNKEQKVMLILTVFWQISVRKLPEQCDKGK
jgi:hypothetical protein